MVEEPVRNLRVLIANEKRERLELLAQVVAGLGHEVIAREIYVKEVGAVTARERPDVALVGLGLHSEHALELITEIVRESSCPVIALLSANDPAYVHEAAKRSRALLPEPSPTRLRGRRRVRGLQAHLRTGKLMPTEPGSRRSRPIGSASPATAARPRDPLAAVVVSVTPIVLESRYRLLVSAYVRLRRSRRGRWALGAGTGVITLALAALAARHFATMSWPLSSRQPGVLVAAALLLVFAQALKAFGWGRLFTPSERPGVVALAAGNGGAALVGVLLPGRFDDAMRIAVVRRFPNCPAGVRVLCLSLVMLGLIDCVALAPLALAGAALPDSGTAVRVGLAIVAAAGVAAAALIAVLPRVAASRRTLRFRLGRWVSTRTTSPRHASESWALVSACWYVRAVAFFLLLGALGVGYSISLALLFLCAGAAAAALPLGLAGAATQAGAGGAALVATGVGASEALRVAVSIGVLGVLTGTAVLVAAIVWRGGMSLLPRAFAGAGEILG